jgi:restriction system protein
MTDQDNTRVRTPIFPRYSEVGSLLNIWDGIPRQRLLSLMQAIMDQTGTPQKPVDWLNPDEWIPERLSGDLRSLAQSIWEKSNHTVNPRHIYGSYLFINSYDLLKTDGAGIYHLTERGKEFEEGDPTVVREIDELEGIPQLLSIISNFTPGKRADFLPDWEEYLHEYSNFGSASTIRDTLRRRILNVVERKFVERQGSTYTITDSGMAYALDVGDASSDPKRVVQKALNDYNKGQLDTFRKRLGEMDPYRFEHLIRDLLEAMDYEDVEVTKQSGDKGVDVVGKYQFGITEITEVVQVKRTQSSITRPILDQLRGALPYHDAIRGTIITLGKFAKGCTDAALYPGAAPITLIDGDKLIELLVEHEIGIQKRPTELIEIDEALFEKAPSTIGETALVESSDAE